MTPVVGNWSNGGVALYTRQISTPAGWVSEATLARLCNVDPLLGRLRDGHGPQTLLRENGTWVHPTDRAQAYGLAVLIVAENLGEARARGIRFLLVSH
ncbi:hypothetical protein ACFSC4_31465 [Deinococcus malanensis]